MINAIAFSFTRSATGDQCKLVEYNAACSKLSESNCPQGTIPQCKSTDFVSTEIYHVVNGGAQEESSMSVELSYDKSNPESFNCSQMLGLLGLGLGMIPGEGELLGLAIATTARTLGATSFVCGI